MHPDRQSKPEVVSLMVCQRTARQTGADQTTRENLNRGTAHAQLSANPCLANYQTSKVLKKYSLPVKIKTSRAFNPFFAVNEKIAIYSNQEFFGNGKQLF